MQEKLQVNCPQIRFYKTKLNIEGTIDESPHKIKLNNSISKLLRILI